jgi:hypothetical protein
LIDGQDMTDGNFFRCGVDHDFLDQKANTLFALSKAYGSKVRLPPLGQQGNRLTPLSPRRLLFGVFLNPGTGSVEVCELGAHAVQSALDVLESDLPRLLPVQPPLLC